jgi:regulatory protein
MTISAIKSGAGAETRRIEFSDGSLFSFKTCYLSPLFFDDTHYTPGREISPDEEERFRFAGACLRAEKAALRLVARAEQTVFGLSRKLEKAGHQTASIRAVAAQLADLGILDDRRFAGYWLRSRLATRVDTPRRLLAGLCGRGIDRDDAEQALRETLNLETEAALLKRYVEKHRLFSIGDEERVDAHQLASLRFLLKREGFSYEAIKYFQEDSLNI